MTAETITRLALFFYAAIAVGVVFLQMRRSGYRWQVWLLYVVERIYVPWMFGWHAKGRCPFPADGAALIIANHRSPVDPLMIWMNHHLADERRRRFRLIHFLMAKEYLDVKGVGWIGRNMQIIPVERSGRDLAAAKSALKLLQRGEWVGIFPEGRLNKGPGLLPADTGVAWLALRAEVPVYPVFIHNAPQGRTMVEPFCTPSRVSVTYGDPIDLSAYYGLRKSQKLLREVTDLMMQKLAETGGLTTEDPPQILPLSARQKATG